MDTEFQRWKKEYDYLTAGLVHDFIGMCSMTNEKERIARFQHLVFTAGKIDTLKRWIPTNEPEPEKSESLNKENV